MKTGIDWYEYQIKEKEKQLKMHKELREIYKDESGVNIDQMIYDDEQYIILLKHSMKTAMWYKDDEREDIGWCADK